MVFFLDEIDAKGKKLAYNPNESDYSPLENTSVKSNLLTLSC